MMGRAIQVREGQCYAKVSDSPGCAMLWGVQSVSAQFLSLPHARLVNQEDPRDIRTISCNTIAEGRFFKLVSEPQRQHALLGKLYRHFSTTVALCRIAST